MKNTPKSKNSNTDKNEANQIKTESSNSVACVHIVERTWGVSSVSFIAAVDMNGKTVNNFMMTKIHCITISFI